MAGYARLRGGIAVEESLHFSPITVVAVGVLDLTWDRGG